MSVASLPLAPDFFVVGAPKSATTALYVYLRSHPAIAMSSRKEPYFWSTDLRYLQPVTSADDYRQLWEGADPNALRGEASTTYLRSEVAVPRILQDRSDARFIAMIRHPVDMANALHSAHVYTGQETVASFEEAWELQAARAQHCSADKALQYGWICLLGDQLERLFSLVPEENRLVILFDDFVRDPACEYRRAVSFLGLPDDGRRCFEVVNENRRIRSMRVERLHEAARKAFLSLPGPVRRTASSIGITPSRLFQAINVTTAPRRPLRPSFEARLLESFKPQIEKLEGLLARDLSHWKAPSRERLGRLRRVPGTGIER